MYDFVIKVQQQQLLLLTIMNHNSKFQTGNIDSLCFCQAVFTRLVSLICGQIPLKLLLTVLFMVSS